MTDKSVLVENINKIHTTNLGVERIKKNLKLECDNVVDYCVELIKDKNSVVCKKGKNFYIKLDDKEITVNSSSFTIITAHVKK